MDLKKHNGDEILMRNKTWHCCHISGTLDLVVQKHCQLIEVDSRGFGKSYSTCTYKIKCANAPLMFQQEKKWQRFFVQYV